MISQPDAVSNMAVPTFDRTLAVQMTVNATELNAPHREGAGWVGAAELLGFVLKLVYSTQGVRPGKAPLQAVCQSISHPCGGVGELGNGVPGDNAQQLFPAPCVKARD